jgi:UPF0271 protein
MVSIDLNSDLGEGFGSWVMGDDDAMLGLVTSANIACGYHAGDPAIMRRTCASAVAKGVRIGAHVGYRDLAGFGRRAIAVDHGQVRDETLYQLAALDGFARAAGDRVRYVKPHGALYHSVAAGRDLADELVAAVVEYDRELAVLGPADSELGRAAAAAGIRYITEGFADRGYGADGRLVPRGRGGAVHDPDHAVAQAVSLARSGFVRAADDSGQVRVVAESLCVHGDSPAAVDMAQRIRAALTELGIELVPFT